MKLRRAALPLLSAIAAPALVLAGAARADGNADSPAPPRPRSDSAASANAAPQAGAARASDDARAIARAAQSAWKRGDIATAAELYSEALSAAAAAAAAPGAEPELQEKIRFNAALASLKAGDPVKAAELFRAATASGSDAAEGLGAALFESAGLASQTNAAEKLKLLEESAAAFQKAFFAAAPGASAASAAAGKRAAAAGNIAAAAAPIAALRDEIRAAAIDAKYGSKQFDELLAEAVKTQRENYAAAAAAFADASPAQIKLLEAAAAKQAADAQIWLPLSASFLEQARAATTNANEFAELEAQINAARIQAESAAGALENIDSGALDAMRKSEATALSILAAVLPPPDILAEALQSQSNALAKAASSAKVRTPAQEQGVAMVAFDIFSKKYGQWLDQMNLEAPPEQLYEYGETPAPPSPPPPLEKVSEATRKEIDDLVKRTLGTHAILAMHLTPEDEILSDKTVLDAERAAADMARIMELLPKPPQQQNQQQQQQQQQDQQQNKEQNQSEQQDQQQQNSQDSQDSQEQQEQQAQKEEQKAQEEDQQEAQEEEPPLDEQKARELQEAAEQDEAEKIMARILEREKQLEAERRKRARTLPPRAGEKDW